ASGTSEYPEQVEGHITRKLPSDLFDDHFSQARLFWNSLSEVERQDLIKSFSFHLGKVESLSVRQQNIKMFVKVDEYMAAEIADNIGVDRPDGSHVAMEQNSPALSLMNTTYKIGRASCREKELITVMEMALRAISKTISENVG